MKQTVKNTIPVYDIPSLQEVENREKQVIALPFAEYLHIHPNLHAAHRHTFYHVLLFTKGGGHHTIDFEQFAVRPGQIYFMVPGQVHSWNFEGDVDGFIINFSEHLLPAFLTNSNYAEAFPFMQGVARDSVIQLPEKAMAGVLHCFETIVQAVRDSKPLSNDLVCGQLISLFVMVNNTLAARSAEVQQQHLVLFNFRKLINTWYAEKHLPREYAAMLYITPNHLNALCRDLLGTTAGDLIRDRVLLEARRLLVNMDISVSEIAWKLNFADNSYFTRFFKKYTGLTPDQFRKKQQ